jgi:hypothetical protein
VILDRAGREYAHWTVETTDTLANFQVQLVDGGAWVTADYANNVVTLLVKGPDYVDTGDGLGTLVAVSCTPKVRCTDTSELVIRQGGRITLT